MNAPEGERLFNEAEAAQMLRLKTRITLWRMRKRGAIGFYQIGDRIFYGESHLAEFLKRCERRPKQEAVAA